MVTKEKFNSFPLEKRYFIAASDFGRAASLLHKGSKDYARHEIELGWEFMDYLFQDDSSLTNRFPSKEKCLQYVEDNDYRAIFEVYLELMDLGGVPKATVREAEGQFA
jgi:hypothetical protein